MCNYSPSNTTSSGDTLYGPRVCWQPFIDWAWDAFDFDKGDWDDGWGWDTPCDINRPLSRTFSGIWCLTYSAGSSPNPTISSEIPILNWGWKYASSKIDELDGGCTNGTAIAETWEGAFVDDRTQLYLSYFNEAVSLRAGSLVHEARHADGVGHDAGNKDSSWEYNGAWRWQVCWLAWFAAAGKSTTSSLKTLATQRANQILANNFTKPPGFTV